MGRRPRGYHLEIIQAYIHAHTLNPMSSVDTSHHSTHSSSSSAVELVATTATITPSSPSLLPSADGRSSFARRRQSWGRVDAGQDPLRLEDLPTMNLLNGPSSSSRSAAIPSQPGPSTYTLDDDDPFIARHDHVSISNPFHPQVATTDYDAEPFTYANHQQGRSSTTSLISSRRGSSPSTYTLDDSAHLTANINGHKMSDWHTDSEHLADPATPRSGRRTLHYSTNRSPIERSGSALKRISRSLRRVSWRVVNFAGAGLDDHILLSGGDGDDGPLDGQSRPPARGDDDDDDGAVDDPFTDLGKILPVRGRTLGLFGPTSRVRRAMYDFLIFPCVPPCCSTRLVCTLPDAGAPFDRWTEPLILCSILLYAVLLTIQASRTLALSGPGATPPQEKHFFHQWEDYIIFALFVFFRKVFFFFSFSSPFRLLTRSLQLRGIRTNVRLRTHP